jgi:magnesium chelatase family protein
VPEIDAAEASLIEGMKIIPMASLSQLVSYLRGDIPVPEYASDTATENTYAPALVTNMAEIKGQEHVKRALEVAAAGGHNMIMCGPPGSGKTLLARSLPSILPPMTNDEALEVTKIYSVSGLLPSDTPLLRHRPFRSPHYTISNAGLVGGGHWPKPGEISLSHRGVLFLDELPEFGHSLLEILRQPLEDKVVTISRAQGRVTFPASFMLIGAMNPCPCGYYGDPFRQCKCPPSVVARYQRRISGPFIDRVDIFVEVPHIEYEKLTDERLGERSDVIQSRVTAARDRQLKRFDGSRVTSNAEMTPAEIRELCKVEDAAQSLLQAAMNQLHLSARAFHRILKLALTIADLEASDIIKAHHVAEAIQYRPRRTE